MKKAAKLIEKRQKIDKEIEDDYDNIDSKLRVISLLHNSKRKLKKDDIIKELETIPEFAAATEI